MIDWTPNPDCRYAHDYSAIFRDIANGKLPEIATYRTLILKDLFFVVQFVLEIPPKLPEDGTPLCNHPFVVDACREIEEGPKDFTLDIFAREHFKSTIITIGETIQYALKHPEHGQIILSYARPNAKRFLFSIKETFEMSAMLKQCFPDVVWENPQTQAPMWSLDDGLILKRKTTRKEPTICAAGLTDGMPTGPHFERRVYDDIVTEDIGNSVDMMEKVKLKFDSSQNLGTINGTHRVTGTYYNYNDPLMHVKNKKTYEGHTMYTMRFKPATDDGTRNGKPVFLPQKRLDALKSDRSFNCQQLLNPTPDDVKRLKGDLFLDIEHKFVPKGLTKFMVVDPAGDDKNGTGDAWAMGVIGVDRKADELGLNEIYILDAIISPMKESEAPEEAARMYLRNGLIMQMGVEKVGQSSAEIHILNALAKRGRHLSLDNGSLVLLRPAGRNKEFRIGNYLSWPLHNGKIFISSNVPVAYKERLRLEADRFPAWHDDGLDMVSYVYDMIKDYKFGWFEDDDEDERDDRRKVVAFGRNAVTGY